MSFDVYQRVLCLAQMIDGSSSLAGLSLTTGTIVAAEAPSSASNGAPSYDDVIPTLPLEFDARKKWGSCVHPIRYYVTNA
jgi:hypothetical protein